jgi:hypothetical protein
MALDAVPAGIKPDEVRAFLNLQPGVTTIHDLHIWPMSTTETALTCHCLITGGHPGATSRIRLPCVQFSLASSQSLGARSRLSSFRGDQWRLFRRRRLPGRFAARLSPIEVNGLGLSQKITLDFLACLGVQESEFFGGLNPFGKHRQIKSTTQPQNRPDDRSRLASLFDGLDERRINLDFVEGEGAEVGK